MPRRGRCESGKLSLAFCPVRLIFFSNVHGKFRIAKKKSPGNKLLAALSYNLFPHMLAVVSKSHDIKNFSQLSVTVRVILHSVFMNYFRILFTR